MSVQDALGPLAAAFNTATSEAGHSSLSLLTVEEFRTWLSDCFDLRQEELDRFPSEVVFQDLLAQDPWDLPAVCLVLRITAETVELAIGVGPRQAIHDYFETPAENPIGTFAPRPGVQLLSEPVRLSCSDVRQWILDSNATSSS